MNERHRLWQDYLKERKKESNMSKTIEDVIKFRPHIVMGSTEDSLFDILVKHYMSNGVEDLSAKRLARAYINLLLNYLEE
jgi:hypothetical protein